MLNADNPANCTFPAGTPAAQMQHCFLSPGELSPGRRRDGNHRIRLQTPVRLLPNDAGAVAHGHAAHLPPALLRKPNAAHVRFASHRVHRAVRQLHARERATGCNTTAHPCVYSAGNPNNCCQANNYGYRDVVNFSTYASRQTAMTQFIQWIKADPNFSKDTFFMSAQDLVTYMQHPFDKTGAMVQPDAVASPDSNGIFSRLGWTTQGATLTPVSGNAANIAFNVRARSTPAAGNPRRWSYVEAPRWRRAR